MRFITLVLVVMQLCFSGCEKTQMAPAPGSGKDDVIREMLQYMREQDTKNREDRKEDRQALYNFLAQQNEENRKFLQEMFQQLSKHGVVFHDQPAPSVILENTTQPVAKTAPQPKTTTSSAPTPTQQPVEVSVPDYFVEADDRPEPTGTWNEESRHIDPRSFAKVDLAQYPVFPDEDRDADPTVAAPDGGKGFGAWAMQNGWETNLTFPLVGDPHAKKGGQINRYIPTFPANLRPIGESHNTQLNYFVRYCMWQTLLTRHPITLEWIPALASHWKHTDDGKTHWFRLNPNAKWSDGSPVTVDDVLETYRYLLHPDLQDPMSVEIWGNFELPVKVSKYIFSITEKQAQWLNWERIGASLYVLAKKDLTSIEPKDFNTQFNYILNKQTNQPLLTTGAYTLLPGNIVDDQSVQITRKKDWWAAQDRGAVGQFNFDTIKWIVVLDDTVALEKVKKGEIDVFHIFVSRQWVEQVNFSEVKAGYIQKRKVFNHEPVGTQYIAMNQEKPPFDVWEVRRAFSHLFPFEEISSKLMYNVYLKLTSYYPAGPYENIENPVIGYDKDKALQLLAKAGYQQRDPNTGLLVNAQGEPLQVTLIHRDAGIKAHWEIFQNACKEVGISLTLQQVSGAAAFQRAQQRDFQMYSSSWGATLWPVPDTSWKSTLKKGSNNLTGLQSEKIDKLIDEYNREFDYQKRIKIMQQLDRELVEINPYILTWYGPFKRLLWWNKFSYPAGVVLRFEDEYYLSSWWWYDEEKAKKLEEAMKTGTKLPVGGTDNRFWNKYREWESKRKK